LFLVAFVGLFAKLRENGYIIAVIIEFLQ